MSSRPTGVYRYRFQRFVRRILLRPSAPIPPEQPGPGDTTIDVFCVAETYLGIRPATRLTADVFCSTRTTLEVL